LQLHQEQIAFSTNNDSSSILHWCQHSIHKSKIKR